MGTKEQNIIATTKKRMKIWSSTSNFNRKSEVSLQIITRNRGGWYLLLSAWWGWHNSVPARLLPKTNTSLSLRIVTNHMKTLLNYIIFWLHLHRRYLIIHITWSILSEPYSATRNSLRKPQRRSLKNGMRKFLHAPYVKSSPYAIPSSSMRMRYWTTLMAKDKRICWVAKLNGQMLPAQAKGVIDIPFFMFRSATVWG